MLRLSANLHGRLNDRLIILLRDKGISTVSDFLRTDSNKLKQFVNIGRHIRMKNSEYFVH